MTQPPAHDPWLGNAQNGSSQPGQQQGQPAQQAANQPQYGHQPQSNQPQGNPPQYAQPAAPAQPAAEQQYAGYPFQDSPQFAAGGQSQEPGFLASLFDLKFRAYATPRILSVVYVVALILIGIFVLLSILYSILMFIGGAAAANDPWGSGGSGFFVFIGIVNLLLTPVLAFFALLVIRMVLEYFSTQFSMAQDLKALREGTKS